jgi:hypothetical protein
VIEITSPSKQAIEITGPSKGAIEITRRGKNPIEITGPGKRAIEITRRGKNPIEITGPGKRAIKIPLSIGYNRISDRTDKRQGPRPFASTTLTIVTWVKPHWGILEPNGCQRARGRNHKCIGTPNRGREACPPERILHAPRPTEQLLGFTQPFCLTASLVDQVVP